MLEGRLFDPGFGEKAAEGTPLGVGRNDDNGGRGFLGGARGGPAEKERESDDSDETVGAYAYEPKHSRNSDRGDGNLKGRRKTFGRKRKTSSLRRI